MYSSMASDSLRLLGLKISIAFNKYHKSPSVTSHFTALIFLSSENMSTDVIDCMPPMSKALSGQSLKIYK